MNITKYEPWEIINQWLDTSPLGQKGEDQSMIATSQWRPAVDIKEDDNSYIIVADIPGVKPEDIDISMENQMLTIKGERNETINETKENYSRAERIKGIFHRRFSLPEIADGESISAKSKHGVLEIRIPKKTQAQARKITVYTEA